MGSETFFPLSPVSVSIWGFYGHSKKEVEVVCGCFLCWTSITCLMYSVVHGSIEVGVTGVLLWVFSLFAFDDEVKRRRRRGGRDG